MVVQAWGACGHKGSPIAGLDHVPVVVSQLPDARSAYHALGFSLKPGRLHEGGMLNAHVKFADGSGVELVDPPASATSGVSRLYFDHLQEGE